MHPCQVMGSVAQVSWQRPPLVSDISSRTNALTFRRGLAFNHRSTQKTTAPARSSMAISRGVAMAQPQQCMSQAVALNEGAVRLLAQQKRPTDAARDPQEGYPRRRCCLLRERRAVYAACDQPARAMTRGAGRRDGHRALRRDGSWGTAGP